MKLGDLIEKHLDFYGTIEGHKLLSLIRDMIEFEMAYICEAVQRIHDARLIPRIETLERNLYVMRKSRNDVNARSTIVGVLLFVTGALIGALVVLQCWPH